MDMQGTPIGSTNQGMKNTTDPATNDRIPEGAGAVASDSLAAESARSGGAFNENRDSNPLSVKGANSTLANTDTSSATTLPPASNATEREAQTAAQDASDDVKGPGGAKYPEGSGGQPDFPGKISTEGYSGGSTAAKAAAQNASASASSGTTASSGSTGVSGGSSEPTSSSTKATSSTGDNTSSQSQSNNDTGASSGATASTGSAEVSSGSSGPRSSSTAAISSTDDNAPAQSQSNVETAPSYTIHAQDNKPKGKNLTEGGFDSNPENNASFNSDIGTENDPGRVAEQQFQNRQSATVGSGPKQSEVTGDGQYDVLETDQNL